MNRTHRKDGIDPVARSRARRRALQAVYAWQMSGGNAQQVIAQFAHEQAHEVADLEYFEDLVRGVLTARRANSTARSPFLDRDVEQVDPIERAVLRIAAYELRHRPDVPYRVVINEAIETTKRFGAEHGHTYVNGVLDHAAAAWRAAGVRRRAREVHSDACRRPRLAASRSRAGDMGAVAEFDLIDRIRRARRDRAPTWCSASATTPRCCRCRPGKLLVVATDTLNAGVHFPADTAPPTSAGRRSR